MTGKIALEYALAILNERQIDGEKNHDIGDYTANAVYYINMLIAKTESLDALIKNIRFSSSSAGKSTVSSLEAEIPRHDLIMLTAFPFGLASFLVRNEDPEEADYCRKRFENECAALESRFKHLNPEQIKDLY